ncbi:LPS O-antigen length regulator Wzz(fepE) [Enterobacter sp.]|uniref:LPS O-antigen length regulator Wzz(fepE) n=1 Tax=Enterobacter sp. TaxID=42895 RepID=UPI002981E712|nr:LPS O-antigen length regulator Wzz(fepE) [Enterobacter sp.]
MSSTIKQDRDVEFSTYSLEHYHSKNSNEIDLLALLEVLWNAKKQIIGIALIFALAGVLLTFLLPQKWTSSAIITPAEPAQWRDLELTLNQLQVLDVKTEFNRDEVFNLFIKNFGSRTLMHEYFVSSPDVMGKMKEASIDPLELQRALVRLADNMKFSDIAKSKSDKDSAVPYRAWNLSFTAPTREEAQAVLQGYIDYVIARVEKDTLENMRNTVDLKTRFEKERLTLDRVRLTNQRDIKIQRLNYSLDVANAAGIKQPVYSNGQVMNDDPDFSITLGANGIAEKLKIEKSLKDISDLNAELRNREFYLGELEKINIKDIHFVPFKYLLSPSYPVKKDGPGKSLIVLIAAVLGGMIACGGVLLRNAMMTRVLPPEMTLEPSH